MLFLTDGDTGYDKNGTVISVGNFDGFHRGHQKLVEKLSGIKREKGLKSLVFSFYPRPAAVLSNTPVKSIFTRNERCEIAECLNIDILVEYPFSKAFSDTTGEDFVGSVLKQKYGCREVVIGESFAFGKDRKWDALAMAGIARKLGMQAHIIAHEETDGVKISSTRIRQCIKAGDIPTANRLLGHDYFIKEVVAHGREKGRELGFPTANLYPENEKLLPRNGVYATEILLENGASYAGVTNVGNNVTFGYMRTSVESYIDGFSGVLYQKEIKVRFKEFIRPEMKFDGEEALIKRIRQDIQTMRNYNNKRR